jgi:hypothetical protein
VWFIPVSTIPVHGKFATSVKDTGGKLSPVSTTSTLNGTISDCLHLKVNFKEKIYLNDNSIIQRCSNKIIKTFLVEDFIICHLEVQISPRIFETIRNCPNGIFKGLGETDS